MGGLGGPVPNTDGDWSSGYSSSAGWSQMVSVGGGGCFGNLVSGAAVGEDRLVGCAGCLLAAEDEMLGVATIPVEVEVLVIVGCEVKGAILPFVAVIVRGELA